MRLLSFQEFVKSLTQQQRDLFVYSDVGFENMRSMIIITCKIHGPFSQSVHSHKSGHGCPRCNIKLLPRTNVKKREKMTLEKVFHNLPREHRDKYDYTDSFILKNKLKICCKIHGDFWQAPLKHLEGQGCKKCYQKHITYETFIQTLPKTNLTKYKYPKFDFVQPKSKIEIICVVHGLFHQHVAFHQRGRGCPRCTFTVSKVETEWLDSFNIGTMSRQVQILLANKKYKVDGFDSLTNTVYEFWGDYWHGNPKIFPAEKINVVNKKSFGTLFRETEIKRQHILKAGYKLVEIWESDYRGMK